MISEGSRSSLLDLWTKWIGRANRSLRKRGFLGAVRASATMVKSIVRVRLLWPYLHRLDKIFDWRFSVDTAGTLILPELQTDPGFQDSYGYGPIARYRFFCLLRQLHVDHSKFVFIDIGCGKGKALLLAARLPFKRIIGVEHSSKLVEAAEENLRTYRGSRRCSTFDLACVDAGEYPIPPEAAVFFFYNPFNENLMRKVLENIWRSLREVPRDAYLIYVEPDCKSLLAESGFLTPVKQTSWYSIYKATGG